jgi:hypothetical protein
MDWTGSPSGLTQGQGPAGCSVQGVQWCGRALCCHWLSSGRRAVWCVSAMSSKLCRLREFHQGTWRQAADMDPCERGEEMDAGKSRASERAFSAHTHKKKAGGCVQGRAMCRLGQCAVPRELCGRTRLGPSRRFWLRGRSVNPSDRMRRAETPKSKTFHER